MFIQLKTKLVKISLIDSIDVTDNIIQVVFTKKDKDDMFLVFNSSTLAAKAFIDIAKVMQDNEVLKAPVSLRK